MALTGNNEINSYAINKFKKQFGENGAFRLITKGEIEDENKIPKQGLFSTTDDFINLTEVARKYPAIQEVPINSEEEYQAVTKILTNDVDMIPLFVKEKDGTVDIIGSFVQQLELKSFEACSVAYLGKPMPTEEA